MLFFLPILQCNKIGDLLQEDLTKFGYTQDMKIEIFLRILLCFAYLLEPIVVKFWQFYFFRRGRGEGVEGKL